MVSGDPLRPAKMELEAAKLALSSMRSAKSMDEFEREWRQYLNAIEKLWQKTERCCQSVRSQFQPWQGTFHRLRKKDMLLRYLKQARDADNHSIQDVTVMEAGGTALRFMNPSGGYIKHMVINNGQIVTYEGDPAVIEHHPPRPVAVPVKNNGEWYNPPTSHLDKPVASRHPVHLAELGIDFYSKYLVEVESKFFC